MLFSFFSCRYILNFFFIKFNLLRNSSIGGGRTEGDDVARFRLDHRVLVRHAQQVHDEERLQATVQRASGGQQLVEHLRRLLRAGEAATAKDQRVTGKIIST